jgi:hypothetical protein
VEGHMGERGNQRAKQHKGMTFKLGRYYCCKSESESEC